MRAYDTKLVEKAVHTIRMLSADGVEKAASGHPGTPMALAGIAFEIWTRQLRYDPTDPAWPDRDRFVLSCGHASMLLYSMLHLSGYDLPLAELMRFRQWGSKTPGHPEVHHTPGVEVTTGPLGQGIANAVGIAASIKMLGARFNAHGPISTARVFGLCSDGDMMEGVSGEAGSLAGHLGLDNLVFFYDDNHITIDGNTCSPSPRTWAAGTRRTAGSSSTSTGTTPGRSATRSTAPWRSPRALASSSRARTSASAPPSRTARRPTGSPSATRCSPPPRPPSAGPPRPSTSPTRCAASSPSAPRTARPAHAAWKKQVAEFTAKGGADADLYAQLMARAVPENLFEELCKAAPTKDAATRVQGGLIEQRVAALVPSLMGGSADLNPSTKTYIEGSPSLSKGHFEGRNVHFGIREHAMGSFLNGVAAADGFIPFGSTFLVFSDYMRPTLRLAALSHLQAIFVYTHDSVYLGEDGPTHQPVEHYWALRLIPNLDFVRPCDALECAMAWTHAIERKHGPTALALTRQKLTNLPRPAGFDNRTMLKGAYVIAEALPATLRRSSSSPPAPRSRSPSPRRRSSTPRASACAWSRPPAGRSSSARTPPTATPSSRAARAASPSSWA